MASINDQELDEGERRLEALVASVIERRKAQGQPVTPGWIATEIMAKEDQMARTLLGSECEDDADAGKDAQTLRREASAASAHPDALEAYGREKFGPGD